MLKIILRSFLIQLIYLTTVSNYYTQVTSSDIKTNVHINIKKYIVPPVIEVSEINFIDENVNNSVDAFESNSLSFLITNTGPGPAIGMIAEVKITGTINGITCNKNHVIPSIETGKKQEFSIPLTSSRFTTNGIIKLEISIVEPNGFSPDPFFVEIKTQAFRAPRLDIVDYSTSMNTWVPNSPVGFDVLLQNTGQSSAENINVNLTLPNSINCYSNNISLNIDELSPSESVRISYDILVPRNFNKNYVEAYLNVTEKFGDYGASWSHEFPFEGGNNSAKVIAIESADGNDAVEIDKASLHTKNKVGKSLVDSDIPENKKVNNRYALVIGNEDYTSFQRTLSIEQNVDYAENDATVFKQYCLNTLGVKEENMHFLINATSGQMSQEIDLISKILSKVGNEAELIVYYAGHGYPDEVTKVPYLIPVDVSAINLSSAIKLSDFYSKLSDTNASKISIFLDACFTGGGRNSGLIASRGIKVKPKEGSLNGNLVVFSASSGDQSSLPYHDEGHGMFTYHLLKKLQETQGDVCMGELSDYLNNNVSLQSLKENKKEQDPTVNTSQKVINDWKNWKF